eukprot:GGOE01047474.1.p1 GENE.GGOE01047474.1~~GGOE01047474.1.p1  ORF type:complete len:127 (+),score=2.85 GGOE01047474.1:326-706(+)
MPMPSANSSMFVGSPNSWTSLQPSLLCNSCGGPWLLGHEAPSVMCVPFCTWIPIVTCGAMLHQDMKSMKMRRGGVLCRLLLAHPFETDALPDLHLATSLTLSELGASLPLPFLFYFCGPSSHIFLS